jgi:chromosomal replication initiator protein
LTRLDMTARAEGRTLDEAYIRQHVAAVHNNALNIRAITQRVAEHFGVKVAELRGPARRKEIVSARSVAIYLTRDMTDDSLQTIGRYFAGRDHTTVTYNVRKVAGELATGDVQTSDVVARIRQRLLDDL